jgi:hypothetical protein
MKRLLKIAGTDKMLFFSLVLTVPSVIVWFSGTVSFLWSLISKYFLLKLPPWGIILIIIIIPFIAFNLGLISYLTKRGNLSKKIFLANLFFILLAILFSLIFA